MTHSFNKQTASRVASNFVDLLQKYNTGDWVRKISGISEDEKEVVFKLVEYAGFQPESLKLDRVKKPIGGEPSPRGRSHHDEVYGYRPNMDMEMFTLNDVSPFVVVSKNRMVRDYATAWLECAFVMVVGFPQFVDDGTFKRVREEMGRFGGVGQDIKPKIRADLVRELCVEIERARPLKPIRLTSDGNFLMENFEYSEVKQSLLRGFQPFFAEHVRDKDAFLGGIHERCEGFIGRYHATDKKDVITCRRCHLRVMIPISARTYGDVRKALPSR